MATKRNDAQRIKLTELTPDPHNLNQHTERGMGMLEASIRRLGMGRGLVVDKHGVVIGGNATLEVLVDAGMEDAIVVPTRGDVAVVVQRLDLDMATDEKARELALADNRVAEVNLSWAPEPYAELVGAEPELMERYWTPEEISAVLRAGEEEQERSGRQPNPCHFTLKFEDEAVAEEFARILNRLRALWKLEVAESIVMQALREAVARDEETLEG